MIIRSQFPKIWIFQLGSKTFMQSRDLPILCITKSSFCEKKTRADSSSLSYTSVVRLQSLVDGELRRQWWWLIRAIRGAYLTIFPAHCLGQPSSCDRVCRLPTAQLGNHQFVNPLIASLQCSPARTLKSSTMHETRFFAEFTITSKDTNCQLSQLTISVSVPLLVHQLVQRCNYYDTNWHNT